MIEKRSHKKNGWEPVHQGTSLTSRGQCCTAYLHIHQRAVLSGPGLLQNLKDGHSAAVHDVHLTLTDAEPSRREFGLQQLLLRPLGIIVGIILHQRATDYKMIDGHFESSTALQRKSKTLEEVEVRLQTHFKEHLHLQGGEAVAFLDSWIPLEERSSRHSPTYPLNGNHLTVGCDERGV